MHQQGEELRRLAAEASAAYEGAKQQARGAASVKRRQESIVHDAQLQSQLRAEAQARREAAASSPPSPRRGHASDAAARAVARSAGPASAGAASGREWCPEYAVSMDLVSVGERVNVEDGDVVREGIVFDTPSRSKVVVALFDARRGPVFRTVHPKGLSERTRTARRRGAAPSDQADAAARSRGQRRRDGRGSAPRRAHARSDAPLHRQVAPLSV